MSLPAKLSSLAAIAQQRPDRCECAFAIIAAESAEQLLVLSSSPGWPAQVVSTAREGGKDPNRDGLPNEVPEPGSLALLGAALGALGLTRRNKHAGQAALAVAGAKPPTPKEVRGTWPGAPRRAAWLPWLVNLLFAGMLAATCGLAQAGTLYIDSAAFSQALAGLQPAWSEDFESFLLGEHALPLLIGGGNAQYSTAINNSRSNIKNNLRAPNRPPGKFLSLDGDGFALQGPGGGPLGVAALSFLQGQDGPAVRWLFDSSTHATDALSTVLANDGSPTHFLGWVGSAPGETLVSLRAISTRGVSGTLVGMDDLQSFVVSSPVPEPASAALLLGGLGLGALLRRQGLQAARKASARMRPV